MTYKSDLTRDGLGYPNGWQSYRAELADPNVPAMMDNYWLASSGPLTCKHDRSTKRYILDRIAAKISR